MASVKYILDQLKEEWSSPKATFHRGLKIPFDLICTVSNNGAAYKFDEKLPAELREFWSLAESARLFEDRLYGQWGLEIVTPYGSELLTQQYKQERGDNYREGDLIVGRFLGDSNLLLVRCDRAEPDFGNVYVVLPLDPRNDWDIVGNDFEAFLKQYASEQGAKYWESR